MTGFTYKKVVDIHTRSYTRMHMRSACSNNITFLLHKNVMQKLSELYMYKKWTVKLKIMNLFQFSFNQSFNLNGQTIWQNYTQQTLGMC